MSKIMCVFLSEWETFWLFLEDTIIEKMLKFGNQSWIFRSFSDTAATAAATSAHKIAIFK